MEEVIVIKGARVHNLKNINLEIPKKKLVVFTGISGSGKSSLAFDTIYAEGQRRYVESLSAYARQFLGVMDKPDVDYIEGLSPAISIDQKSGSHNPRSTVGTITEIYDYLRLLFARIGHPHCPSCGQEISHFALSQIVAAVTEKYRYQVSSIKYKVKLPRPVKFMILAPLVKDRKGEYRELFEDLRKKGYSRVRVDKIVYGLDEDFVLIKTNRHTIEAVVDRITISNVLTGRSRLTDSIEQALKLSDGLVIVSEVLDPSFEFPAKPQKMVDHLFSEKFACPKCNLSIPEIEPRSFSFNSPHGACPFCTGIGSLFKVDPDLVINPSLTLAEGGVLPFARMFYQDTWFSRIVKKVSEKYAINPKSPLSTLSEGKRQILLFGTGKEIHHVEGRNRFGAMTAIYETFAGIIPELERRYRETESGFLRMEIEKYMRREVCPECHGARIKKEALSITTSGNSIVDVVQMSIRNALSWTERLYKGEDNNQGLSVREQTIATPVLKEIKARLQFLVAVGLEYLTLDRPAATLAGGEAQRIRLASQIGSGLSGVLYVLDEPSIGSHPRDNKRLIETLKRLRDLGNTVIVVEHDREMMEQADWLIDFGPGAGEHGGEIVAKGTIEEIKRNPNSLTGKYLSGRAKINIISSIKDDSSKISETKDEKQLTILGACQHNLKNINVSFPLGKFICVSGVSGSGKSTLIHDILYHALMCKFNPFHKEKPGFHQRIVGEENLDKVVLIDQSPIGRTSRSNPATYTGTFAYIRQLFASTSQARIRGYKPGRFSFNVKGGRCEACEGEGQIKIEMQFLPDVYVTCDECLGKRYNNEALEVTYKGKNITQVLEMTVEEALDFFSNIPHLAHKLATLNDVGLGYIHLGQPAPTLSGGEAQRVKLATELSKKATGRTLYLLDEPTTGLHFADLEKLLFVLKRLVRAGNTVIIIEHNLDVIKNADWIIDLGPEGGETGGKVIATGTPYEVSLNKNSYTGQFLRQIVEDK